VNDEIHDCVLTRKEPNASFACVNT